MGNYANKLKTSVESNIFNMQYKLRTNGIYKSKLLKFNIINKVKWEYGMVATMTIFSVGTLVITYLEDVMVFEDGTYYSLTMGYDLNTWKDDEFATFVDCVTKGLPAEFNCFQVFGDGITAPICKRPVTFRCDGNRFYTQYYENDEIGSLIEYKITQTLIYDLMILMNMIKNYRDV